MKLVICEKPSVAQSVARVMSADKRGNGYYEGNGLVVSWCLGHLVELAEPDDYDPKYKKWSREDLPIIPQKWKYRVTDKTRQQYAALKKLMERDDVDSLVCATDAGREGELIFRLVYNQCGCRKPFERLWISSMEDAAIREGFENLRDGREYESLYEAALCRERADWIVGMNATRFFTTLYGRTLHVGRVISPTLAMTVLRESEIAGFVSKPFYAVTINMDGISASSGRIDDEGEANSLMNSCRGVSATVTSCERKERSEKAPLLYDLTTLQREANRQLGYTAQQTLDYAQDLYEKKLLTYPRTDSRYLTDDMEERVPELVEMATALAGAAAPSECRSGVIVDSKKVSDHHALIPTMTAADADLSALPIGEREILRMVATRLAASVAPPYRYAETVAEFQCGGGIFDAKGKTVIDYGWRAVEKPDRMEQSENALPDLHKGDVLAVTSAEVREGKTKPKPHYTEDTLLAAMEKAGADEMPDGVERRGIGTPATRAGVIERLVQRGFLDRTGSGKKKYLIPTDKGTALITVLPEELQSASMTADWEEKLLRVERGEYAPTDFMDEIGGMVTSLIETYQPPKDAAVFLPETPASIGKCPVCGADVVERPKSYSCSSPDCKFVLWKDNRYFNKLGKRLTENVARHLLEDGSVRLRGCYSEKKDKNYDATILMSVDEDGRPQFEMAPFKKGGHRS